MDISQLLQVVVNENGSDLHLVVGKPPSIRIDGDLRNIGKVNLEPENTVAFMKSITGDKHQQEVEECGTTDFGFSFEDQARFRVSVYKERGNLAIALRLIPSKILSFEEIGLAQVVKDLCLRPRGLILVTGPTGSGKTTTLASMLDFINNETRNHIITIEDPIEYYHPHKKCVVNQREVGEDVTSFAEALRRALRQDPDVILVGEMRDLETMSAAIRAAETGHLVFATLHTTGASTTINRIVDAFPTEQQEQIRTQLSTSIVAVLSQTLMPKKSGKGRVAAFELMIMTAAIQNLIRDNKVFRIDSVIQTGGNMGMTLLDDHLFDLFKREKISFDVMMQRCKDAKSLQERVKEWSLQQQMQKKNKGLFRKK